MGRGAPLIPLNNVSAYEMVATENRWRHAIVWHFAWRSRFAAVVSWSLWTARMHSDFDCLWNKSWGYCLFSRERNYYRLRLWEYKWNALLHLNSIRYTKKSSKWVLSRTIILELTNIDVSICICHKKKTRITKIAHFRRFTQSKSILAPTQITWRTVTTHSHSPLRNKSRSLNRCQVRHRGHRIESINSSNSFESVKEITLFSEAAHSNSFPPIDSST